MFQQHRASLGVIEPHGAAFPLRNRLWGLPIDGESLIVNDAVDEDTTDGVQNPESLGVLWIQS